MLRWFHILALSALTIAGLSITSREALAWDRCMIVDPHRVCCDCSVSVNMRILLPTPRPTRGLCRIVYRSGLFMFDSISVNDGFSLGVVETGPYWVGFRPRTTGSDTVAITVNGRHGNTGKPCASRIRYNVTVVDGKTY
jgi:hypothetical protein